MTDDAAAYTPPKVWTWNKDRAAASFANINRPVAGPTHDKDTPRRPSPTAALLPCHT